MMSYLQNYYCEFTFKQVVQFHISTHLLRYSYVFVKLSHINKSKGKSRPISCDPSILPTVHSFFAIMNGYYTHFLGKISFYAHKGCPFKWPSLAAYYPRIQGNENSISHVQWPVKSTFGKTYLVSFFSWWAFRSYYPYGFW